MAVSHAIGKQNLPYRALYQPQYPAAYAANIPAVVRDAVSFRLSKGLVAVSHAFVLIYSASAHLFASSTFFSIFITPLIYRLKMAKSVIRQIIIFWVLRRRLFKNSFFYFDALIRFPNPQTSSHSISWTFFVS